MNRERDEEQVDDGRDAWHQEQADEERSQAELEERLAREERESDPYAAERDEEAQERLEMDMERRGDYFETAKALTMASVDSELRLWQACRGVK